MRNYLRPAIQGLILTFLIVGLTQAAGTPFQLTATAQPNNVLPGDTVAFTIALANSSTTDLANVTVTDHLPAGFSYLPGSSAMRVDGGLITVADPATSGNSLTWSQATLRAAQSAWFYGIHTFIQDSCDNSHIDAQLTAARDLMGAGAFVKQLFYGIHSKTSGPRDCWVYFVNRAYDLNLQPVVRLQGPYGGTAWLSPPADGPGNYATIAAAFQRVVAGLPRRDGHNLFVEVWNEPNLNVEWGNAPNPWEYAHFLLDVSQSIRALADPRIVILNGGLAPGGNINHLDFIDGMAAVPGALESFDVWASHPYPANHPPEYNIHDGTAVYTVATIDTYLLELERLAEHGRPGLHVLLTETGHNLGNNVFGFEGYPPINESNRADFMVRAFRDYWKVWPEILGATPFELVDPHNNWSAFDWLYPSGAHHQQFDAVAALGKAAKALPTDLTITFRARAAFAPGTYYSQVDATASNGVIAGTGNTAPITVASPTPTATPTSSATPAATGTATVTATPSPTATATPANTPTCTTLDLNHDGTIDVTDIMLVAAIWGAQAGDANFVPAYDFNGNGQIDVADIMQVAGRWNETCATPTPVVSGRRVPIQTFAGLRALARNPRDGTLLGISRTDLLMFGKVLQRFPLGVDLRDLVISGDGTTAYVSDAGAGSVLVVDATNGNVVTRVSGLSGPTGLAVGGPGLWVSEGTAGRVALVNPNNYGIIARVQVGKAPGALAFNDLRAELYVAVTGQGTVAVVSDAGTLLESWPVGGIGLPQGMALFAPARRLYVAYAIDPRDGAVVAYDVGTRQRLFTWQGSRDAPMDPLMALTINPSGKRLFAVGGQFWWMLDTQTGDSVVQRKEIGAISPFGVVIDPTQNKLSLAVP